MRCYFLRVRCYLHIAPATATTVLSWRPNSISELYCFLVAFFYVASHNYYLTLTRRSVCFREPSGPVVILRQKKSFFTRKIFFGPNNLRHFSAKLTLPFPFLMDPVGYQLKNLFGVNKAVWCKKALWRKQRFLA